MSEYQYYEFVAIDRPLDKTEQAELRACSTRASITSSRFVNEYHWGDLKADPLKWMARYFDAHLYLSNFGSRSFHLRFPLPLMDPVALQPYDTHTSVQFRATRTHLILSFYSDMEPDEYDNEDDYNGASILATLLPLREDLIRGDFRSLYVG